MICAILIGREGSTGLPGKNIRHLLGMPMVEWPLLAARAVDAIERIYVSTDSARIREIAERCGARIIDRPPHLCTKEALGEHAYQHAHGVITAELAKEGKVPQLYVLLMANAPTVSPAQLREGITILRDHPEYDSAVTVSCYN